VNINFSLKHFTEVIDLKFCFYLFVIERKLIQNSAFYFIHATGNKVPY